MTQSQSLLQDRYQLMEMLGKGGMAVVFRARDRMLERDVAIKILKEDYAKDASFRERFRQEAKAAANLSHPNIVTIHDFGYEGDRLFIVMEHVPGRDLHSILQDQGRFGLNEGLNLAIKACKGLGYAHRAGLVHCDVKPHNFLVTLDGQLKVTDFGIARALASINPDEESDVVWGSPQFFSPEQAGGQAPSPASDVYSLGVVLYLMFTGQLPFIGTTSTELARLHRRATPIPPREINPLLPPELEEVIQKVLAKEPSARYRTADQLGRVLQLIEDRAKAQLPMPDTQPAQEAPAPLPPLRRPPSSPQIEELPQTPPPRVRRLEPDRDDTPPTDTGPLTASDIDWTAVFLALVAMTAVGGLLPFGIWVVNSMF